MKRTQIYTLTDPLINIPLKVGPIYIEKLLYLQYINKFKISGSVDWTDRGQITT